MELLGQNKIDHHQRQVAILSQDSFYKVLTPEQKAKAQKGQFNFDHPGINPARLVQCWRNHPSTVCTSSQMHDHSLLSWTFIIYTLLIICIVGHIWVFKFDQKKKKYKYMNTPNILIYFKIRCDAVHMRRYGYRPKPAVY